MLTKRINEIEARKAEIRKEIDGADAGKLAELNAEVDRLNAEADEIRSKMDLSGKLGAKVESKADDVQARAKEIKANGRMSIGSAEVRSTLLSTNSLAKPVGAGATVNDAFNPVSSIVDQVKTLDVNGCSEWREPYVVSGSTADVGADGAAPTASDPTFAVAAIKPKIVNVLSYVSKHINNLTPVAYADKVRELALEALRVKVASLIVNGDTDFCGIKTAVNTDSNAIYDTMSVTDAKIGADTLRKIVFSYGGDNTIGAGARLYLNKADLIAFGDVRGTNEKKAVYEIIPDAANPNSGIIKDGGLSVPYSICSGLTALSGSTRGAADVQTMIYGDPLNYELGLFGDYSVEVSRDYKFAEGLLTILGEIQVGGNLIKHHGFVVVTLAKTA